MKEEYDKEYNTIVNFIIHDTPPSWFQALLSVTQNII